MDIPVKTLKSGFSLPVYGLGTSQMGNPSETDEAGDAKYVSAIKAAIDHGITHIDTAESYGGEGHTEELVGRAIRDYPRDKFIITTKVSADHQTYDGVLRSFEASLKRLGTDYVDLYLFHRYPAPGIHVADTMRAFDRLVDEGVVKHIGASNMTIRRFEDAQAHTSNKLVCNQLHYSLQMREAELKGLVDYCQQHDVLLSAWSPLQRGALEDAEVLHEMAEKYHKTVYQVALNWLIIQPNVVIIPKTTAVEHLEENLGALGWELSAEDAERLAKEFPNQLAVSGMVPLDYAADIEP